METGEHRRERLLVVREEVMAASLIVIELANNAEFELFIVAHALLRLLAVKLYGELFRALKFSSDDS